MVLLKSVQMNVYKLTTQQNNLAVSEFHSFIRQNDVSHLEVTVRSVESKNVPEDPAHFRQRIQFGTNVEWTSGP